MQKENLVTIPTSRSKLIPSYQRPRKKMTIPSTNSNMATTNVTGIRTLESASNNAVEVASSNINFFSGAIGNLVVPYALKKVLKPHQIEGVVFLWNCLTGHGKAAQVSPHCCSSDNNEVQYKGCILSDGTYENQ